MKLLKKTLAILLCLIMAVCIMPLSAVAKDYDVVKVDHVTVKTDSIFKVGEALPKNFKADYTDHLFKLEDVDWSCTEVYNEWDYKSLGAFSYAGDTFEKGRGYELVLTFYSDQKEVDVEKFTLKTGDSTYTSYGTSSGVALRQSNVLYYHQPYTLAYFYIPFTELGHKVTTYDELQSALLKSEDYVITLGKDITKEIGLGKTEESEAAQLTVNGKKWLNLNGKKLKVVDHSDVTSDKDESLRSYRTLFTVSEGAEFTVDDTRGKGEIKYDAHFISPNFFALVHDEAFYFSVPERNMFNVHGKLTVNGGKFDAGGAKEQYLADEACNAYQIAAGYICKTEGSGQATFNGGEFIGHTFSENIEQYYRQNMSGPQLDEFLSFKGGPYYVLSGNITINGGDFINEGVGNFVDEENSSKLRIINGSFDAKKHSKLRVPIRNQLDNSCKDWKIATFNIPEGSWNSNDSLFLKDGKLCFNPAKDYLEDYAEDARIDIFKIDFYRANPGLSGKNIIAEVNYAIGTEEFTVVGQTSTTYTKFLYSAKLPPQYLIDKGYVLNIRGTLFDPSGKQLYMEAEDDSYVTLYPEDYCTTPGTYTYKVTFVLMDKDGKLCGVKPYTVLINAVTPCETHNYNVIKNTATCTWHGTITEICTKCGNVNTETSAALNHTYVEYSDPWSSDSMYHWKYCYRCNQTVDKGVHGYRAGESVCVTCGLDNSCDYGNAMDLERNETHHWWACETHAPEDVCPNDHKLEYGAHEACSYEDLEGSTLDGVTNTLYNCGEGYVCDGCGHYFGETGNHEWVVNSKKPATCYSEGYFKYKCSNSGKIDPLGNTVNCGYKYVTIPKTDHTWTLVSDTATCKAGGKATYKCTTTGCTETKVVDSPATGHIYGLVSDTATCTSAGTATYKCNTCSASYTEASNVKEHNYVEESYKIDSCTKGGTAEYKCADCGHAKKVDIAALNHTFEQLSHKDATDTEDGYTEYFCSVCGEIKKDIIYANKQYKITVTNGTASKGEAEAGETITLTANAAPEGKVFDKWVVTGTTVADATKSTTTFIMPTANVTANATYKDKPVVPPVPTTYTITVTNGTASKVEAEAGETITLTANAAPEGKVFDKWVVTGATVADATKATTTFTMPASNVTAKATYKDKVVTPPDEPVTPPAEPALRPVTVVNGTTSSEYSAAGTTVYLTAEQIDGKVFSHWVVEGATVEDANAKETSFTMGDSAVNAEAVYTDCECNCHKGGIVGFFYKIILFFQKLFGNNLVCEACGAKH